MNDALRNACLNPNDEFYTYLEDIEKEIPNYRSHLAGKTIFLPCDTSESEFWTYFCEHFEELQLEKVMCSHLEAPQSNMQILEKDNTNNSIQLNGNGDFFSPEIQKVLDECDIVITNPPFSRLKEMVQILVDKEKDFILIGNENVMFSKTVWNLYLQGKVCFGKNQVKHFKGINGEEIKFGNTLWITSFPDIMRPKFVPTKTVAEISPLIEYDNYGAVNIDKVKDIPKDYAGIMGVPCSYIKQHNSEIFDIVGIACGTSRANKSYQDVEYRDSYPDKGGNPMINGRRKYARIFIKNKTINV